MQYFLLIYDQEKRWTALDQAHQNSETQEYGAFGKEFASAIRGGDALQPTLAAKTGADAQRKAQVTDGRIAETKEQLGGYYLVDAKDVDGAVAIASKIPWAGYGSIEVRPILTFS